MLYKGKKLIKRKFKNDIQFRLQTDQITQAASAALTYMVKHPGDTVMQKNFENSIETPGVNKTEIVDLEENVFFITLSHDVYLF